jgi:hypothetical protein
VASLGNITFACEDPDRLADFWAAALGYVKQEAPPEFMEAWLAAGRDPNGAAAIVDPEGKGPRLFFEKKPKTPTTSIPIHLDLNAWSWRARGGDQDADDRPLHRDVDRDEGPGGQRLLRRVSVASGRG